MNLNPSTMPSGVYIFLIPAIYFIVHVVTHVVVSYLFQAYMIRQFSENNQKQEDITAFYVEHSTYKVFEENGSRQGQYIYFSDLSVKSTGKKFKARVVYSFKEEV